MKISALILASLLCFTTMALAEREIAIDWYKKGFDLENQNKIDQAVQAFDNAKKLNTNNTDRLDNIIYYFANSCRYTQALDAVDEAIKINPRDSSFWYLKAWTLKMYAEDLQITKGENISNADSLYNQSLDCLNRSLELSSLDERNSTKPLVEDVKAHIINDKGLELAKAGRWEEALEDYNHSLKVAPYNSLFNYDKLYALTALHRSLVTNDARAAFSNTTFTWYAINPGETPKFLPPNPPWPKWMEIEGGII